MSSAPRSLVVLGSNGRGPVVPITGGSAMPWSSPTIVQWEPTKVTRCDVWSIAARHHAAGALPRRSRWRTILSTTGRSTTTSRQQLGMADL